MSEMIQFLKLVKPNTNKISDPNYMKGQPTKVGMLAAKLAEVETGNEQSWQLRLWT